MKTIYPSRKYAKRYEYENRIVGSIIGPKKVMIVPGTNKIISTIKMALPRIKIIDVPIRAKEVGLKTPCVKTGFCEDCDFPERICRVTAIMN